MNGVVTTEIWWAPVYVEPIAGSGERVIVAVVGVSSDGSAACLRTFNPRTASAFFGESASYGNMLIGTVVEELDRFAKTNVGFENWSPPFGGVHLGQSTTARGDDLLAVLGGAATLVCTSYQGRDNVLQSATRPSFGHEVRAGLLQRDHRLEPFLDVKVHLTNQDQQAVFSFLNPRYAANIVVVPSARTPSMNRAKAALWNLDLLADAPAYLFRPETRELILGVNSVDPDPSVRSAVAEITDEAGRRDLAVVECESPTYAIAHISEAAL